VIEVSLFLVILIQYSQRHSVINHCDRPITLLSDTDTVVRHSMMNHCDRRITILSNTDTVQSDISLFLVILTVVRDIA
jgi:hypothetical protein